MNPSLQMEILWLVRGHYYRKRAYRRAVERIEKTYSGTRRQLAQALLAFLPEMRKMQAVEAALAEYDRETGNALLQNIIHRIPPQHLNCPVGRRRFYEMRREFLASVAKKLGCL